MEQAATPEPPERCPICDDERQYVGWDGQRWTRLAALAAEGRHNRFSEEGPGLVGIGTEPSFAIGQRALLVETPDGNVLWDCISYVDEDTVAEINRRGGLAAVAISHPHYYGVLAEWSAAFGGVPVWIHEADREWLGRTDGSRPAVVRRPGLDRAGADAGQLRRALCRRRRPALGRW